MKKYRTGGYGKNLIEAVEIEKETESSVWIKGSRNAKRSTYYNYFDTWEEAHSFILHEAQSKVDSVRRQLEYAKSQLGNIKGLRENQKQ